MYRIKQYTEGWVVEVRKRKWYGKIYWTHFVSVAGIESMAWHHKTQNDAFDSLLEKVKLETIDNSLKLLTSC